jgi:hypothetical protein
MESKIARALDGLGTTHAVRRRRTPSSFRNNQAEGLSVRISARSAWAASPGVRRERWGPGLPDPMGKVNGDVDVQGDRFRGTGLLTGESVARPHGRGLGGGSEGRRLARAEKENDPVDAD